MLGRCRQSEWRQWRISRSPKCSGYRTAPHLMPYCPTSSTFMMPTCLRPPTTCKNHFTEAGSHATSSRPPTSCTLFYFYIAMHSTLLLCAVHPISPGSRLTGHVCTPTSCTVLCSTTTVYTATYSTDFCYTPKFGNAAHTYPGYALGVSADIVRGKALHPKQLGGEGHDAAAGVPEEQGLQESHEEKGEVKSTRLCPPCSSDGMCLRQLPFLWATA